MTILEIRRELKDVLLTHHATIKELQKQVAQMNRKIATIDKSKKSTRSKKIGTKTVSRRKTVGSSKKTEKIVIAYARIAETLAIFKNESS